MSTTMASSGGDDGCRVFSVADGVGTASLASRQKLAAAAFEAFDTARQQISTPLRACGGHVEVPQDLLCGSAANNTIWRLQHVSAVATEYGLPTAFHGTCSGAPMHDGT